MEDEIWKDIIGFEGIYQISNYGRVKSCSRINKQNRFQEEKILKPNYDKDGYRKIGLSLGKRNSVKTFRVCRLVALHFMPNPNNLPYVNHKNGIRDDDRVENLEWCDNSYNQWHRCHVNNNPPKSETLKKKIKVVLLNGEILFFESIKECSNFLNVSTTAISRKLLHKSENPSFRRKNDKLYGIYFEYL